MGEEEDALHPSAVDFEQFVRCLSSASPEHFLTGHLNIYDEKFQIPLADLCKKTIINGKDVLEFLLNMFIKPKGVTLENVKWLINKTPSDYREAYSIVGFLAFYLEISKDNGHAMPLLLDAVIQPNEMNRQNLSAYVENLLKAKNTESIIPENQENVVEFLEKPYISRFSVDESFRRKLDECFASDKGFIYVPCFSVCQRSGTGKTKLMIHAGNNFAFMVYILLEERKYGTPKHIINLLKSLSHPDFSEVELEIPENRTFYDYQTEKATRFIYALSQYLVEFVEGGCGQNKGVHHEHDCNCYTLFLENFRQKKNEQLTHDCWNRVIEIMNAGNLKSLQPFKRLAALNARFVIALDEARNLIDNYADKVNPFQIIRHALAVTFQISKKNMLCMIVTDTNSNITNFAPTLTGGRHFSRRNIPSGQKLHDPFYILSGQDIKASEYLEKAFVHLNNLQEFILWRDENTRIFVTLGNPLWSTHLSYPQADFGEIKELISYAGYKLNEGSSSRPKERCQIAFLAAKCNLDILPQFELAKDLVAGNMALLHYLTVDRDLAFVGYPSDPVLAAGATAMIRNSSKHPISHPIETLQKHVSRSIVDAGQGGELVAQIYLLAAFESAAKDPFKSILVSEFLLALLGPTNFEIVKTNFAKDKSGILEGRIFFNHTIKLQTNASSENLQHAFIRGAMLSGRHVQPGWDQCIPVALPNGQFSALYFQDKSYGNLLSKSQIKDFCISSRLAAMAIHEPEAAMIYNSSLKQSKATKRRKTTVVEDVEEPSLTVEDAEIADRMGNIYIESGAEKCNTSINNQEHNDSLSSIIENPGFDSHSLHFLINFHQGKSSAEPNFDVSQQDRSIYIEGSASQIVHHAWCIEDQKPEVHKSLDNLLKGQIKYKVLLDSDPVRHDFYRSDHGCWKHDIDILHNPK